MHPLLGGRSGGPGEQAEERPDIAVLLVWMAQGDFWMKLILVAAPNAFTREIASIDEVGDDPLGSALGDPDAIGDIAEAHLGIGGDAQEDLGMIGEKGPLFHAIHLTPISYDAGPVSHSLGNANCDSYTFGQDTGLKGGGTGPREA